MTGTSHVELTMQWRGRLQIITQELPLMKRATAAAAVATAAPLALLAAVIAVACPLQSRRPFPLSATPTVFIRQVEWPQCCTSPPPIAYCLSGGTDCPHTLYDVPLHGMIVHRLMAFMLVGMLLMHVVKMLVLMN